MAARKEITLKEAIEKYIDAYKLRGKFDEKKLKIVWQEIVGESLAMHTREIHINDKKLYIKTESSVARQELSFMKSRLVSLINRKMNKEIVREIVIL